MLAWGLAQLAGLRWVYLQVFRLLKACEKPLVIRPWGIYTVSRSNLPGVSVWCKSNGAIGGSGSMCSFAVLNPLYQFQSRYCHGVFVVEDRCLMFNDLLLRLGPLLLVHQFLFGLTLHNICLPSLTIISFTALRCFFR